MTRRKPLAEVYGAPDLYRLGGARPYRREGVAVSRPDPPSPHPGPAEPPPDPVGFSAVVRHLTWLSAPSAEVTVDPKTGFLLVSCFPGTGDVEHDPFPSLSVGFHRAADEYLLTSLGLLDAATWSTDREDVELAETLVGPRIIETVTELLPRGGAATVALEADEAQRLVAVWAEFVREQETPRR